MLNGMSLSNTSTQDFWRFVEEEVGRLQEADDTEESVSSKHNMISETGSMHRPEQFQVKRVSVLRRGSGHEFLSLTKILSQLTTAYKEKNYFFPNESHWAYHPSLRVDTMPSRRGTTQNELNGTSDRFSSVFCLYSEVSDHEILWFVCVFLVFFSFCKNNSGLFSLFACFVF